jgi:uncharacterized protein YdaU (DUF1376 family)
MKSPTVWFRLIIGDHFRRVAGLTRLQRGALNDLVVQYFSKGCLPTDETVLARLCEMTRREWLENRDAIKDAGQFMDDWRADWIEAELKDVGNRREQTAKGRAKLAERRAAQPPQPHDNLSAKTDTVSVSQSQSQSQSHKKGALQQGRVLYPGSSSPLDVERYGKGGTSTREGNGGAEWFDDDERDPMNGKLRH